MVLPYSMLVYFFLNYERILYFIIYFLCIDWYNHSDFVPHLIRVTYHFCGFMYVCWSSMIFKQDVLRDMALLFSVVLAKWLFPGRSDLPRFRGGRTYHLYIFSLLWSQGVYNVVPSPLKMHLIPSSFFWHLSVAEQSLPFPLAMLGTCWIIDHKVR